MSSTVTRLLLLVIPLISLAASQKAPLCTIPTCASLGERASCTYLSELVTCAVYHEQSIQEDPKFCTILCTRECVLGPSQPVASDGRAFCTECVLQQVSCESGFIITGPIGTAGDIDPSSVTVATPTKPAPTTTKETKPREPVAVATGPEEEAPKPKPEPVAVATEPKEEAPNPKPEPVVDVETDKDETVAPSESPEEDLETEDPSLPVPEIDFDLPMLTDVTPAPECGDRSATSCCEDLGISCLTLDDGCTTTGTLHTAAVPCANGLVCVIEDFGFPATDVPTIGRCKEEIPEKDLEECSVDYCASKGKDAVCQLLDGTATCGAWAKREDGGDGPNCAFLCTEECAVGNKKPLGSDGKRYCSICKLASVSCAGDFEVYGPVKST